MNLWIEDPDAPPAYPVTVGVWETDDMTGKSHWRVFGARYGTHTHLLRQAHCRLAAASSSLPGLTSGSRRRAIGVAETFYETQTLKRKVGMDKETQQRRLLNLVKTITTRALALPSMDREAFIDIEITNFRQTSADTYQANPAAKAAALELADKMREWIFAMIKMLEVSGEKPGKV